MLRLRKIYTLRIFEKKNAPIKPKGMKWEKDHNEVIYFLFYLCASLTLEIWRILMHNSRM